VGLGLESLFQSIYIQSDNYWKKMKEYRVNTYYKFVDFKATYGSIDRAGLFKAMEEFHVPIKIRCLVELTLKTVNCRVETFNGISEPFETKIRLRQGDALSCLLFNLALEKYMRDQSGNKRYHTS
jgi:sorting nexin-29